MNQSLENAVRFVSDELTEHPEQDILSLIEKAGKKFDLTPLQAEQLFYIHQSALKKSSV